MTTIPTAERGSILLTSNFSNTTGFAWKFFRRLQRVIAREMHARGVGVRLSFAEIQGEVRTVDPDIPIGVIQFDLQRHTLAERHAFLKYIRAERVRWVYFTDFRSWSPLFPLLRVAGARHLIVHNHMSEPEPYLPAMDVSWRGAVKWGIHRAPWLSADFVYACSEFVRQRLILKGRYPATRIRVIHHGIELDRFTSYPRAGGADSVHIVLIARAVREKGIHILLEAAARLRRLGEEGFRITYGGDGPEYESLQRLATTLGIADKVTFVGLVPRTEVLLREADVVVVPSIWGDAAPLSVLEGMAAGRALVVTDVGGIPEQIGESGCALIVPPRDPTSLANALQALIHDPGRRADLGRRARRRAYQQFSERRFHRQVVQQLLEDCEVPD